MAIAGLHNFSVLDSSYLRNSQSQASRPHGDGGRIISRASSILQMWRELEVEQAVRHAKDGVSEVLHSQRSNGSIADLSSIDVPERHDADYRGSQNKSSNFICNCSPDFGEVERERVRQTFREWMQSGHRDLPSNVSRMNDNARAEWLGNEQGRVRIREGVGISNCQQRVAFGESREEQAAEIGGQIDRVCEGLVANHMEEQTERIHWGVRRLRGRQVLLDMLKKAERERQRELEDLLQHQAVSHFAHRNRIQSLLRGRFLQNERMVENERLTSAAASELGLLRQRHTVSGLREGFLSRLEHSSCSQASTNHANASSNSENNVKRNGKTHQNNAPEVIDEVWGQFGYVEDNGLSDLEDEVSKGQQSAWKSSKHDWSKETNQNEVGEHSQDATEVFDEQSESSTDERTIDGFPDQTSDSEGNTNVHKILLQSDIQVELGQDQFSKKGQIDCNGASVESNQQNCIEEGMVGNMQESTANEWSQEFLGSEDTVGGHIQEDSEVWHQDGGVQEAEHNLSEGPADDEALPVGRVDTSYLSDDDSAYNMELRELLSRRRVSNLLHSGFRETLDQVLLSYAERQSHATIYWELDDASSTPTSTIEDVEVLPFSLPSPPMPIARSIWDQESHHDSWHQHSMNKHLGIEWEIINDLRIDMASLQQRMNDMQQMLEACMDMQLDLQRSIRQEFSAALHQSADSQGVVEDSFPTMEPSKWDNVRKGICCICCDTNIDSLLYRCGHMCTCSKCANRLIQTGGKCPMCCAPIVEVIRIYSVQ